MKSLKLSIVNLFMWGGESSYSGGPNDTTIIKCDGFAFKFKQHDILLKHKDFENKRKVTTHVEVQYTEETQILQIFEIIDDICYLLSFAQQSYVRCETYGRCSTQSRPCSDVKTMRADNNIIDMHGLEIRNFIEQTYPTFKKLKSSRQLTVVFDYLCEANRANLATEASLILHYVIIENLKHTYALERGYQYQKGKYNHPLYPPQNYQCINKEEYCFDENTSQYIHKLHSKCGSTEMTKRMFESIGISRSNNLIKDALKKRNRIIHEGLLLPLNDSQYSKQAREDLNEASNLIQEYLFTLLNYKGTYCTKS
ncbi:hypothetical protein [Acinetobacter sp. ANC 4805]|uniref:hypothetical protein n=1 Tax=Acinetobacter sp. ANC 4805 TaxID=2923425 RepID=UPI001F4AD67E|nr:hypothetical protein [Acinetobacter sp. ANC 4805]MCH7311367.1 hypothetical protein [Acinetobacter sp. ANC 4805]